ncbi:hypothetical protein HY345_01110 [Candidatus Microgenomates bacterium]|nr:hypothetical protein [Candidatus Microgenomates bacterium]
MMNRMLERFGLNEKEATIYLEVLKRERATPLELSRFTSLNRTTIYRLLDRLKELGLVEEIIDQHKVLVKSASLDTLDKLLIEKEQNVLSLKNLLPDLKKELNSLISSATSPTEVVYFRGQEGLRQFLWNTTKAKGEVVGYGFGDWNEGVGRDFAEKLRQEHVEHLIHHREIQNVPDTDKSYTSNKTYLDKFYRGRQIPPKKLEINHDTYIYNDVFAFYNYVGGEYFAIEIHNTEIAKTQKQIFDILWEIAKP